MQRICITYPKYKIKVITYPEHVNCAKFMNKNKFAINKVITFICYVTTKENFQRNLEQNIATLFLLTICLRIKKLTNIFLLVYLVHFLVFF